MNFMKRNIPPHSFLLVAALLITGSVWGQQYPLFTNYVLNDFGFNPAIAGSTSYVDARMTYRRQWVGIDDAPQTQILSVQGPMKLFGLGGYLYNDVAGKLRRTGVSAAFCYGIDMPFGKLGIGVSGGAYNVRLKTSDDPGAAADPLFANGVSGVWTPDVSAGIYLNTNNGFFVGFSVPHLLKQEVKFTDNDVFNGELLPHYYGMAGFRKKLNEKLTLEPSVLVKYIDTAPLQFDVSLRALLNNKFWVGGSYRHQDAVTGMVGYELSRTTNIAYAYDFTMSNLREASSGSHEITLGFKFGMPKDRDGDGIVDMEDQCPDVPGPKENGGCPESDAAEGIADRDKDGILDKDDDCPDIPGLKDYDGCPFGDKDKDGIRDDIDKCPDVFGVATNQGCPPNDRDLDGIVDEKDKCPDTPGPVSREGCPIDDGDGDGIVDALDKCPNTPGTADSEGCPLVTPAEKTILDLAIRNLYFDTDKDVIKRESYQYLDKLAELLVKRPKWRVKLTGHADARGSEEYNLDLSRRRAEATASYLVGRGVERTQLVMDYYGERRPVASNTNEDTRWENRRVEMQFVWE
jgi:type IX secretion system PorP/SprF family membrane protein